MSSGNITRDERLWEDEVDGGGRHGMFGLRREADSAGGLAAGLRAPGANAQARSGGGAMPGKTLRTNTNCGPPAALCAISTVRSCMT